MVTRLFDWLAPGSVLCSPCAGFIIAAIGVSLWEVSAYYGGYQQLDDGPFKTDTVNLLRSNAFIAAAYMILGAGVGWIFHYPVGWPVLAFVSLTALAVVFAPWWLRQKIIWQKAALPYLARFANITVAVAGEVTKDWVDQLKRIIDSSAKLGEKPPVVRPAVVVIAGPGGSGRTRVASAIGTESAFVGASVRYVSFEYLAELAEKHPLPDYENGTPPPGPSNIGFWPWSQVQLLIIDDIGPAIKAARAASNRPFVLGTWLTERLSRIQPALNNRHTVWIMGATGDDPWRAFDRSVNEIVTFLKIQTPGPVLAVLMNSISVQNRAFHLAFWARRAVRSLTSFPGRIAPPAPPHG
jgi:hypothetical protein